MIKQASITLISIILFALLCFRNGSKIFSTALECEHSYYSHSMEENTESHKHEATYLMVLRKSLAVSFTYRWSRFIDQIESGCCMRYHLSYKN